MSSPWDFILVSREFLRVLFYEYIGCYSGWYLNDLSLFIIFTLSLSLQRNLLLLSLQVYDRIATFYLAWNGRGIRWPCKVTTSHNYELICQAKNNLCSFLSYVRRSLCLKNTRLWRGHLWNMIMDFSFFSLWIYWQTLAIFVQYSSRASY